MGAVASGLRGVPLPAWKLRWVGVRIIRTLIFLLISWGWVEEGSLCVATFTRNLAFATQSCGGIEK